jgi:hypothetical protein
MHQHLWQIALSLNKSSIAGHRSGERGQILSLITRDPNADQVMEAAIGFSTSASL